MVLGIDLAEGTGGVGSVSTTYQPRHKRYEIVGVPAGSGTLTLASDVTFCVGYELFAELLEYSAIFGIMGPLFYQTEPFPLPFNISLNPTTGAWAVLNPTNGEPALPSTPFVVVYRCKIPLALWDESAPIYG